MLVALGAALVAGAAAAGWREISPYLRLNGGAVAQALYLSDGSPEIGMSRGTKAMTLQKCSDLAASSILRVVGHDVHGRLLLGCHTLASSLVQQIPTSSEAWLVMATTSLGMGDDAAFNIELARARATAPHVHWLAARRSRLSETHFDLLGEDNRRGHQHDLESLATSAAGLQALAEYYAAQPSSRDRIAAVIEKTPGDVQRQFIYLVQTAPYAGD